MKKLNKLTWNRVVSASQAVFKQCQEQGIFFHASSIIIKGEVLEQ